jgi:hypothetical protein
MKRWYIYWIILLFAACSSEETFVDHVNPGTRSSSDVTIRITFPEAELPVTRAITATDENKVTHIDLLVFTKDGNTNLLDDKFAYKISVNSGITGTGAEKTFTVSLENMASDEQRIVLLANLPDDLRTTVINDLDDDDVGVTTMNNIINQLRFTGAPWRTALTSVNFTAFPMFGQMFDYKKIDHENPITSPISINMIRTVARIDVGVDIGGTAQGFGTDFSINKVYLCNVSDSGYVAPHDDYVKQSPEQVHIGRTNVAATRYSGDIAYTFPALPAKNMFNSIYVPESDSLIVNGNDSIKPAFLVIDAQYKGNQRFYRIDFTKNATYIPLLRNHNYTINILGIRADGYATLEAAKKAPLNTLNFSVVLDGNSNINDISSYFDQYALGLSLNEVIFDWEKNYIGKPSAGASYYTVRVYSTYNSTNGNDGDWSVEYTPAGFTATKHSATELRITANNWNYTGAEIPHDSIRIRAGLLTKGITLRQTGGANSAVAKFAASTTTATVRLPLGFVSAASSGVFGGKTIAAFKDTVLWQESGTGVTFKTSMTSGSPVSQQYITVTATIPNATANKYANAVIALTWEDEGGVGPVGSKEPDDVVWSWHVWTMPENYETSYPSGGDVNADFHNPNQLLLMKRVLGKGAAAHHGVFYQWGRKDPFFKNLTGIEPAIFHATEVNVATNKANAIRLPSTFYKGTTSSLYDWHGTNHDNALWSDSPEPGTKTYYDPCPEGWRMPPHYTDPEVSPWKNDAYLVWTEYANGYIRSDGVTDGATEGRIWTASANNEQAWYTYLPNSTTVNHAGITYRASALSVRCVKDLKRKY